MRARTRSTGRAACEPSPRQKHGQSGPFRDRSARHRGVGSPHRGRAMRPAAGPYPKGVTAANQRFDYTRRSGTHRSRRGRSFVDLESGSWQGSVRRSPAASRKSARPCTSLATSGRRRTRESRASSSVDRLHALVRLERTGAVDDEPARPRELDRAASSSALQGGERRDVLFALQPGDVGMAADGAGRGAGRVEQHGVERLRRRHAEDVGGDECRRRGRAARGSASSALQPARGDGRPR